MNTQYTIGHAAVYYDPARPTFRADIPLQSKLAMKKATVAKRKKKARK